MVFPSGSRPFLGDLSVPPHPLLVLPKPGTPETPQGAHPTSAQASLPTWDTLPLHTASRPPGPTDTSFHHHPLGLAEGHFLAISLTFPQASALWLCI